MRRAKPSGAEDLLQQHDAPFAIGAMFPYAFVQQLISLFTSKSTRAAGHGGGAEKLRFASDSEFWQNNNLLAEVSLKDFRLSDWFPRTPGRYWAPGADFVRTQIENKKSQHNAVLGSYYEPAFKSQLIEEGGIGSIRLRSRRVDNEFCWFGTAYTSNFCHMGVPLVIPETLLRKKSVAWGDRISVTGQIRFLHNVGLDDIGNQQQNSQPLVLYVENLNGLPRKVGKPFFVSPVTLFKRTREWIDYGFPPQHQYTFANCEPKDAQVADAAGWMERYAEQFEGRLITNFDEQRPILANAPLSYQRLVDKTFDRTLICEYVDNRVVNEIANFNYEEHHHMGDNISAGDNSIIFSHSPVTGSTIINSPNLSEAQNSELTALVDAVKRQLALVKETLPEEAKRMDRAVEDAVAEATKPPAERKNPFLELTATGLLSTAKLLVDVAPGVMHAATQLATFVQGLI